MGDKDLRIGAGTASSALAACMLFYQGVMWVLAQISEKRLPERLVAVGPALGLVSCAAIITTPVPIIFGLVGISRGGIQRRWGIIGLGLTAFAFLAGYLAQAAIWRQ